MKGSIKKCGAKAVALVICVCLICSVICVPVSAAGSSGSKDDYFVVSLLKSTRTVCLNKLVGWAMDGIMNSLFEPEDSEEVQMLKNIQAQMSDVLKNQQKIADELKALEGVVEVQTYLEVVNDFMEALELCEPFFQCYDTLNKIDKDYAGDPDALKIQRLRALTEGLGISNMTSASTSIDDKYLTLYSKYAGPISYTVNGKVVSDGDLFDVYREIKRYQYCWENEAWDEMENFFNYAAYSFALISFVETASVQARIERCRIENEGKAITDKDYLSTDSLETWLYNDGGLAADSDLESHIQQGTDVFNEHLIIRHDEYRHFWKPGHELLFYTSIKSLGSHPVDEPLEGKGGTSAGTNFGNTQGMRVQREGENANPVDAFWNTFYTSSIYPDKKLIDTKTVNTMLEACGHKMTLAEIIDAGDFDCVKLKSINDCTGVILRKDDELNPFKIKETHNTTWVEYIGMRYTDNIKVYPRYVSLSRTDNVGKDAASDYATYYYYHTSDGSVRWYVKDNGYTAGSLAQVFVCEDTCMHEHLAWVDGSGVEPTCQKEGKEQDFKCLDCGKVYEGKALPKFEHKGTWHHTSTEHWMTCDECGEEVLRGPHVSSSSSVLITGIYICDDCGYMTYITPPIMNGRPDTADRSNIVLYFALATLSLGGMITCVAVRKKKSRG